MKLLMWIYSGLLIACFLITGCAGGPSAANYYRDEQLMNEARSFHYQTTYNQGANAFIFDQNNVGMRFSIYDDKEYAYGLALHNKTDQPIVINWNGVEYIDVGGSPHSMIHEGIHFLSPITAQTNTVVAGRSGMTDVLRAANRQEQDGAMRFVRVQTPPAMSDTDDVIIVIPMKVLGVWTRHRYNINIGLTSPMDPPYPLWD